MTVFKFMTEKRLISLYFWSFLDSEQLLTCSPEIVFVNTTNIVEALEPKESRRSNKQIQEYNASLQPIFAKYGVPTLDFYAVSTEIPLDLRTDWVHYKTAGSEIFANVIMDYLLNREG